MKNLSRLNILIWAVLAFSLAACQTIPPTKLIVTPSTMIKTKGEFNAVMLQQAVMVDVRKPFQYQIGHAPHSINLTWADLALPNTNGLVIDRDREALIKRIALKGISNKKPVLILYSSPTAEDAKSMAWLLKELGVIEVFMANVDIIQQLVHSDELLENAEPWATQDRDAFFSKEQWAYIENPWSAPSPSKARSRVFPAAIAQRLIPTYDQMQFYQVKDHLRVLDIRSKPNDQWNKNVGTYNPQEAGEFWVLVIGDTPEQAAVRAFDIKNQRASIVNF